MKLREIRKDKRKTQWDLRLATGIHQCKISLIERGYINPSPKEKSLIADVLGVQVEQIDWQPKSST